MRERERERERERQRQRERERERERRGEREREREGGGGLVLFFFSFCSILSLNFWDLFLILRLGQVSPSIAGPAAFLYGTVPETVEAARGRVNGERRKKRTK